MGPSQSFKFLRSPRIDGIRELFPCTTNAVLHISVQNLLFCTRVGSFYGVSISKQPGFAFLYRNPEQCCWLWIAGIQNSEHLLFEHLTVLIIQVYDHDNRSRKVLEAFPISSE